jgi:hypothetical protein
MKYKFSVFLFTVTIIISFLTGCKKERNIYKPYFGKWYARSCGSSGGPQNCGFPYPIPRNLNYTLTLNTDRTFIETSGSLTKQGTYTIQRAIDRELTGSDDQFDKLTQNYNGQKAEYMILIHEDGSLGVQEKYVGFTYIK